MYLDDLYFRIVYSKNGKKILTSEYLQSINNLKYFEVYKFWQDTKVLKLKLEDTIITNYCWIGFFGRTII